MEAGLCSTPWTLGQLIEMGDAAMPKPGKRGPYKKTSVA
jgi:hypothetical protein